ncbi:MAG: replication/maintenance protein RepL [Gammaproteobacteria bacterium]|nr:replication/maintenance protein RepL [Gammaproteobacteria bacterium]
MITTNADKNAKKKKIVHTEIERNITTDSDGVIINEQQMVTNKMQLISTEPPYIKVYLKDISMLNDLGKHDNAILHEIFKISQYNTNLVTLNKYYREQICKALDTTDATVRNAISKLSKKELLLKKGTGVYMLNPTLFGHGTWENIKGLRMTIEYTDEGRKVEVEGIKDIEYEEPCESFL